MNKTNLRIYDGKNQVSAVTVELLEDNKTAYIISDGSFTQLKEYNVVVENVASKDDAAVKVAKTETLVTTLDTVLPTTESIVVRSPKTLQILFSEPVQTGSLAGQFPTASGVTDRVKIDGINAFLSSVDTSKLNTENKITVTLGTALTVGDHKVVVSGINDFANLPVAEKEFNVTVVADTTLPVVESAVATSKDKVTVKFNKPVDASTVTTTTLQIWEAGNQKTVTSNADITTKDDQTFEVALATNLTVASLVDASVKVKGIKDAYGNEVKVEQVFNFKATDDLIAPVVSDVKVNSDNTLEVTFSEDVTGFAGNSSSLELYDKDNKKVITTSTISRKTVSGTPSDKIYTVSMTGASSLAGNYTLKFVKEKVTDNSVRSNKLVETTKTISLNDKTAPKYTSATFVNETAGTDFNSDGDVLDSKVTIYFDEAMDSTTLTNSANYILDGKPLADIKGASLSAASDNKSVTITINRATPDSQFVFTANNSNGLKLIAVKDIAGNTLDTSQVNNAVTLAEFTANKAFNLIIDTSKVEATAKNKIKLYAESGELIEGIDPNKVKFAKAGTAYPLLQVTGVTLAADKKSAVLTLNNNLGADTKVDGDAITLYADKDAITTTTGVKSSAVATGSGIGLEDKIRPTVQPVDGKFEVDGDKVTLKFDEVLTDTATAAETALVVKDSQGTQLTPADYVITMSGKNVSIQITKAGFNDKVTVSLSNNVTIKDIASPANYANDFAAIESKDAVVTATGITLGDTGSPSPVGVTGIKQKETATVAINSAAQGTINAIVTATGMTNSPKTVAVPLLASDDDNAKIATKVRTALENDTDVSAFFNVSGTGAEVVLTAKEAIANDSSMNINLDNNSTSIITDAATSVRVDGKLPVKAKVSTQVTAPSNNDGTIKVKVSEDGTELKTVNVAVANEDTAAEVATKIAAALAADTTVNSKYNVTQSTDTVVIEQKVGQEAPVTVTVVLVP